MPDTARVIGEVKCPSCRTPLLNSIRCQWGAVPGIEYRLGDPVKWMRNPSGAVVQPFKLIEVSPKSWQWNYGDPRVSNVILFDEDVYTGNHRLECPACKAVIAACIASVHSGVFEKVAALESPDVDRILGGSRGKANVAVVHPAGDTQPEGTFEPREDWFDHPIEYVAAPGG